MNHNPQASAGFHPSDAWKRSVAHPALLALRIGKEPAIGIGEEDILPSVAALHDMMRDAGHNDTSGRKHCEERSARPNVTSAQWYPRKI